MNQQQHVYELSLDIDSAVLRNEELTECAGQHEKLRLVAMYIESARACLKEYCTSYGLHYADDDGFTLAGNKSARW